MLRRRSINAGRAPACWVLNPDGNGEVGNLIVEAFQELVDDRLDHRLLVAFARERLHRVDGFPEGRHDHVCLGADGSREHGRIKEPAQRPKLR
jgi:hypothetical protein